MAEVLYTHSRFEVSFDEARRLVHARWHGVVDKPTLETYFPVVQPLLEQHRQVNYFNDFTELDDFTMGARWMGAQRTREQRPFILKSALCGSGRMERWMFHQFIRITGRDDVRMFESADEALAWLFPDEAAHHRAAMLQHATT